MKRILAIIILSIVFMIAFISCEQQSQNTQTVKVPVTITIGQLNDPVYVDSSLVIPFFIKNSGPFPMRNLVIYLLSSGIVQAKNQTLSSLNPREETVIFIDNVRFEREFLRDVSNTKSLEFEYFFEYQANAQLSFCVAHPNAEFDPNMKTLCKVRDTPKITNSDAHVIITDAKVEIQTKNSMMLEFKVKKNTNEKVYYEKVSSLHNYLKDPKIAGKESIMLSIGSAHFDLSNSKCYFNDVFGNEIVKAMREPFILYFEGDTVNVKCYVILTSNAQNLLTTEPFSFQAIVSFNSTYSVAGKLTKSITIIVPR